LVTCFIPWNELGLIQQTRLSSDVEKLGGPCPLLLWPLKSELLVDAVVELVEEVVSVGGNMNS
jgi:hypothetical protein